MHFNSRTRGVVYDRLNSALCTQSLISHLAYWIAGEEITFMMQQLSILFIPYALQFCFSHVQQFFLPFPVIFLFVFSSFSCEVQPDCSIFLFFLV